ncbi:unnamed protein product [Ostreobium quekettii]|uniref:NOT2/NOT3/NOT5 C-terminal domain-containing protein n=1 Tax=Ostreobium quekettii TaxID=121088 RepID=A0A8S1IPF9_9CHLO|nr:unnamed protein product [Ostreobium quekettii]|eukprot:evm.model.scf_65.18 EVM.evm.TU.scf_65.18   scf_65:130825-136591(+)
MLPNPGSLDPSGRNYGGQFAPSQGQAGNSIYGIGGNIPVQHTYPGLQGNLVGARPGFGGPPVSSGFQQVQQADRFGAGGLGPGALQHLGQYGQSNRGLTGHPLGLAGFNNNSAANRGTLGAQIGLPNQGLANAGVRPMLDRPAGVMNSNFPAFGGTMANPAQVAGLSGLQWSGGSGQGAAGLGIGAMSGRPGIRNLGGIGATIGGGIQRDMGMQRGMPLGGNSGGVSGLMHPGIAQQNNTPIPSQDLLAIMNRSNPRTPGMPSGLLNFSQMPGAGQGVSNTPGGAGMLNNAAHMSFMSQQQQQQQQQRMGSGGPLGFNGLDQHQRVSGPVGEPPKFHDASDFPSLTPKAPSMAQGMRPTQMGLIDSQPGSLLGQPQKSSGDPSGFSIQKEDFPALPRAMDQGVQPVGDERAIGQRVANQGQVPVARAALRVSQPTASVVDQLRSGELTRRPSGPSVAPGVVNPYFQPSHNMPASVHDSLRTIQQGQAQLRVAAARGLVPGRTVPNLPGVGLNGSQQGSSDRFSLLGLLSVIRMTDEDLAMLALGQDLTTLGLKLDQVGSDLHKTFLSPWSDHQLPGAAPDVKVPRCYLNPPEKLRSEYLTKFKDETLFYLFYSMPGEEAQHLAGYELTRRGLVWHKDHKVWMMRLPNAQLQKSPEGWERGSYIFFDTDDWKYSRKDNFVLKYEALEAAPTLPQRGNPARAAAILAQQNVPTGATGATGATAGGAPIMVPAK